jgi:Protein of unknown function (DUF2490)
MKSLKIVTVSTCLATAFAVNAQEWRSWNSLNITVPVTRKVDFRYTHLRSYNMSEKFVNNFNQHIFRFTADVTKRLELMGGILFMQLPQAVTPVNTTRVFARGTVKTRVTDNLNWFNSLQVEHNSASETRFRNRVIVSTRLGLRKRLELLNLAPSVSYTLFYNMGGREIQYYDENKQPSVRQSPSGFQRGRFQLNLNSKINKYVSVAAFYMRQDEFNLLSPQYRQINVVNPNTGRIRRAFDNYNTLGLSLNFTIGRNGTEPLISNN